MGKEYKREEAIRLIEAILQKLAKKAEEAGERSCEDPQADEAELYLRTAGAEFSESLKRARLGSALAGYDNDTISVLLGKCILAAAEFELERELHEDFVIVESEDEMQRALLGEILNKETLFSGSYECLPDAFFDDFCNRTVSRENYVEGLGYFIDFNEILRRRSESIKKPSFGIPDKDLFKPPAKSFYVELNALRRVGNVFAGLALGSRGDYVYVHTPKLFGTTDDIFIYRNPYIYTEDGNLDTGLEDSQKRQGNSPMRLKRPPIPKKGGRKVMKQQEIHRLLEREIDKENIVGGAVILIMQGVAGIASGWNLDRLFVSIWTEEIEDYKMNFFTIQIPRCKNLEQEYWYVPVSCGDSDFNEIMKRVRAACAKE